MGRGLDMIHHDVTVLDEGVWSIIDPHTKRVGSVCAVPDLVRRHHGGRILLALAESHGTSWLRWVGEWKNSLQRFSTETLLRRTVELHERQPDHLVTFYPDDGNVRRWLLVVDEVATDDERGRAGASPQTAFAWDRCEWDSASAAFEDGGAWGRFGDVWLYLGKTTPEGLPGIVVVDRIDSVTTHLQAVPHRTESGHAA